MLARPVCIADLCAPSNGWKEDGRRATAPRTREHSGVFGFRWIRVLAAQRMVLDGLSQAALPPLSHPRELWLVRWCPVCVQSHRQCDEKPCNRFRRKEVGQDVDWTSGRNKSDGTNNNDNSEKKRAKVKVPPHEAQNVLKLLFEKPQLLPSHRTRLQLVWFNSSRWMELTLVKFDYFINTCRNIDGVERV